MMVVTCPDEDDLVVVTIFVVVSTMGVVEVMMVLSVVVGGFVR